jgi:predicted lactoylglutathione lyase
MLDNNLIILYVKDSKISTDFYSKLLEQKPFNESNDFACLTLNPSTTLGIWRAHTVEPEIKNMGSGVEITFYQIDKESVDTLYENWQKQGISIAQTPTQMDFGYTFTALDPDGHRLRVYTSSTCV